MTNKQIPLIIKEDLELNKKFISNLFINKNKNHIFTLFKVAKSNLLFNNDFIFHHFNAPILNLHNLEQFYSCSFTSEVCKTVFKDGYIGYVYSKNLTNEEGFNHYFKSNFGSNGFSFYYEKSTDSVYLQFDFIKNAKSLDEMKRKSAYFYKTYRYPNGTQIILKIQDFINLLDFIYSTSKEEFDDLILNYEKQIGELNLQNFSKNLKKEILIRKIKKVSYFTFIFGLGYVSHYFFKF